MQNLNLPEFSPKTRETDKEEIFCIVRKKWVALTPEEWVRQHFLNLLITHLEYPKGLIKLEYSLKYFKNAKRSDIVVLDKEGNIFLLAECKAPSIKLDQSVLDQASQYNKILNSQFLAISNGMRHFIWKMEEGMLVQISEFPLYIR